MANGDRVAARDDVLFKGHARKHNVHVYAGCFVPHRQHPGVPRKGSGIREARNKTELPSRRGECGPVLLLHAGKHVNVLCDPGSAHQRDSHASYKHVRNGRRSHPSGNRAGDCGEERRLRRISHGASSGVHSRVRARAGPLPQGLRATPFHPQIASACRSRAISGQWWHDAVPPSGARSQHAIWTGRPAPPRGSGIGSLVVPLSERHYSTAGGRHGGSCLPAPLSIPWAAGCNRTLRGETPCVDICGPPRLFWRFVRRPPGRRA